MANFTDADITTIPVETVVTGVPVPYVPDIMLVPEAAPAITPSILSTGPFKIGKTTIVQLAATTWTEVVLQSLASSPRPYPASRWLIKANSTIYVAQAVHSLKQAGVVVNLPANPATATSGAADGNLELLSTVYFEVDTERNGENSIWLFGPVGNEIVRITNIAYTPYDEA